MIFLKNYFVSTTKEIDFIPIIHDVRYAIRDSQMTDGLVTIHIPGEGAVLLLTKEDEPKNLKERFKNAAGASLSIPFQKKELVLEPKQMIYLIDTTPAEKRREFFVQIMGEAPQAQQPPAGRPQARPKR